MAIVAPKDIADAYAAGRNHTQRFLKNAGLAGDGQWQDWAYASGQPAYDARIGDATTFTPIVATRNDAIFFPPIGGSETRHLIGLNVYMTASSTGQLNGSYELYDLLAVYPLIGCASVLSPNTISPLRDTAPMLPTLAA